MKYISILFASLLCSAAYAGNPSLGNPKGYLKSKGLNFYACQMGGPFAGQLGSGDPFKKTQTVMAKSETEALEKFLDKESITVRKHTIYPTEEEVTVGTGGLIYQVTYLSCDLVSNRR